MTVIRLVTNLLAVVTQDRSAFEEEMSRAAASIARVFLSLFLCFSNGLSATATNIARGTLTVTRFRPAWVALRVCVGTTTDLARIGFGSVSGFVSASYEVL
jgi:hypothetical protein